MLQKVKVRYLVQKPKNLRSISINSSFLNKKNQKVKKYTHLKDDFQNRSTSFQTVKKINLSKLKKKTPSQSRINSERSNLSSTIKKKQSLIKSLPKKHEKVFLDHRSDFLPKPRSLSTPKFGQNLIRTENLTGSRIDLLFELQTIKKEFTQNLNQISFSSMKRLNPFQQNLRKCLVINKEILEREWLLIRKSCINIKSRKENEIVENMIWEWEKKRHKIHEIQQNLEKALQVLLL